MPKLSKEEIRKILGLDDPMQFSFRSAIEHQGAYPRQSGRTTNMLVHALFYAQMGDVVIVATESQVARLRDRVLDMAQKCNIDPSRIEVVHPTEHEKYRGRRLYAWFLDHWLYDSLPEGSVLRIHESLDRAAGYES